jgi:hypothetical protein
MKKLVFVVLILAVIAAGGAFAQGKEWYNSYAPGVEESKLLINAGIGFGVLPYKLSLPPISASIEYAGLNIPLSIGGYFGIAKYEEDVGFYHYSGTMMGIGARAAWHFNFAKNLDTYVGLNLGWMIWNQTNEYTLLGRKVTTEFDYSAVYYAFNIGTRYFFTKNIGAYAELGYSPISIISVGLSLKF